MVDNNLTNRAIGNVLGEIEACQKEMDVLTLELARRPDSDYDKIGKRRMSLLMSRQDSLNGVLKFVDSLMRGRQFISLHGKAPIKTMGEVVDLDVLDDDA